MKLKTIILILLVNSATTFWAQTDPTKELPRAKTSSFGATTGGSAGSASTVGFGGRSTTIAGPDAGQSALLERNFFAPELIMQNQNAIGLSTDQQAAIRAEMKKMMAQFTDLQWQQSAETEALATLVKQDRPDEKQVIAQLDKLLSIENEIKRLNTGVLVRIKNTLTPEQQAQLRSTKRFWGPQPKNVR
jgi:Spy/CpxP family protein refolding chaperone